MRVFLATLFVCLAAQAQNPAANITVDVNANRRAINPNVYGLAYASTTQLKDLNVPVNRYGGNNTTRYNWQINADNRGQDWYFESIGDTSSVAGERGNTFIANTRAGGAQAMITIPIIGWVAKLGSNRESLQVSLKRSMERRPATTGNGFPMPATASNNLPDSR
jgi:hypothetical protein